MTDKNYTRKSCNNKKKQKTKKPTQFTIETDKSTTVK